MPWTPQSFRQKHNKKLNAKQSFHAAAQANRLLQSGMPEGEAIAIANKYANAHPDVGAPLNRLTRAVMKRGQQ